MHTPGVEVCSLQSTESELVIDHLICMIIDWLSKYVVSRLLCWKVSNGPSLHLTREIAWVNSAS